MQNGYGLTETSPVVAIRDPNCNVILANIIVFHKIISVPYYISHSTVPKKSKIPLRYLYARLKQNWIHFFSFAAWLMFDSTI